MASYTRVYRTRSHGKRNGILKPNLETHDSGAPLVRGSRTESIAAARPFATLAGRPRPARLRPHPQTHRRNRLSEPHLGPQYPEDRLEDSHLDPHCCRTADAMGRAGRARRERHSRRLTSRLRRAVAGVASSVPGLLRRPARAVSLAAPLALLLTALAFAAPAQAQTTVKLVGNTSQPDRSSSWGFQWHLWQPFTTGSSPTGYKLTGVDIELSQATGNPAYTLSIETPTQTHTEGSSRLFIFSGTRLATLDNPASLVAGLNRHTAPGTGIDLAPNTTYRLVLNVTTPDAGHVLKTTDSHAEDAGGLPGVEHCPGGCIQVVERQ